MTAPRRVCWFVAVFSVLGVAGAVPPPPVAQRFKAEADRVLESATFTTYRHRSRMNNAAGIYQTDCSGFIAFLLRKVSPTHLDALPVADGRKKPRAVEYYEFIRTQPRIEDASPTGWIRVPSLVDAQPGDILAWRYVEITPGRNTGHVLIVAAAPVRLEDGVFRVEVMDSTATPHDDDTRKSNPGGGIGKGSMLFKVNAEGQTIAYQRAAGKPFHYSRVELGRMVEKR